MMSREIPFRVYDPQKVAHEQIAEAIPKKTISLIDGQSFTRESIRLNLERAFSVPIDIYSSIEEFKDADWLESTSLIIIINICASGTDNDISIQLAPSELPVVVLSYQYDVGLGRAFFDKGVKGYILMSMNFDVALAAIRFVWAGGTYLPREALVQTTGPNEKVPSAVVRQAVLTERQLEVARSIQSLTQKVRALPIA
jgi:DNA-binding NarL/FixJ family response regulator